MKHSDVIIVGGGLAGGVLSLALAQAGLAVTIADRQTFDLTKEQATDGRSYALAHASIRLLRVLGVWEAISDKCQPILSVKACDGRAGAAPSPLSLIFPEGEIDEGPMGWMVEDRHLRPALQAAMERADQLTTISGAKVTAQDIASNRVSVTLETVEVLSSRLLVGADGASSQVAARAGITRAVTDYGQDALVCVLSHEHDHQGRALQYFQPGGPLALLPLTGRRVSVVWSEERRRAQDIARLNDVDFLSVLGPIAEPFLGAIQLAGPRSSYPLARSFAAHTIAARLALVGDAAMAVHPIAGQGLNQGLRDVATLAEVLADAHRRGEDIGAISVLDAYRQWRSFDRSMLALATDGFNRLFSNDNPILRLCRDLGMAAVTAVPAVRRHIAREAAGLSGDLPRLLQGRQV